MSETGVRMPWSRSGRPVPRRVLGPIRQFTQLEIAGGVVLLAASVIALIWANVATGSYESFWSTDVTITIGDHSITENLLHVVNDGLMTIFFLVIGLEVKRELVLGELSTRQAALLPMFAAFGGVIVPALIFTAMTAGDGLAEGWGIPIATDVAFALAALAALGRRVPSPLMAFLLGVAVVDDIVAIVVIAFVYTDGLSLAWLAAAAVGLLAMWGVRELGVRHIGVYLVLGAAVWFAVFESGVHATIAGVAIAMITPTRPFQSPAAVSREAVLTAERTDDHPAVPDGDAHQWRRLSWLSREAVSPLTRMEHALHPWSSFVVLPIFALANAGIVLDRAAFEAAGETPVATAAAVALIVGKCVGLTGGTFLAVRLGLSRLPAGVRWAHVAGVGLLAGIGFTVSLFITELAYGDPALVDAAKLGVLVGSVAAAIAGTAWLRLVRR
ncbi:MAG TPA: Na+/H+ antiporter NhaA [Miltoncostaeaceae bacterium]|nr:Na+/H+ antiporter NhaA [Miltoncostaeaceae bacterium]